MSMVYNDFDTFLEDLLRESGYGVRVFSFRGITHIYMKEVAMYKGVLNVLSGLEELRLDKVKFFVVKGWALPWVNSVLNCRPSYKESVVSYFVRVTGNLLFVLSSAFMLLLVYSWVDFVIRNYSPETSGHVTFVTRWFIDILKSLL